MRRFFSDWTKFWDKYTINEIVKQIQLVSQIFQVDKSPFNLFQEVRQTSPIWTHYNFKSTLNFPPHSPKPPTRVSLKGCVSMTLCVTSGCHADTLLLLLVRAVLSHFSTSRKVFPPCGKAIILWLAIICWLWRELSWERENQKKNAENIWAVRGLERAFFFVYREEGLKTVRGKLLWKKSFGRKIEKLSTRYGNWFFGKKAFSNFFRHFKFEEKSHTVNVPPPPEVSRTHHVLIPPHVVTGKWHNRHHLTHTRTGISRGG